MVSTLYGVRWKGLIGRLASFVRGRFACLFHVQRIRGLMTTTHGTKGHPSITGFPKNAPHNAHYQGARSSCTAAPCRLVRNGVGEEREGDLTICGELGLRKRFRPLSPLPARAHLQMKPE